MKAIIQSELLCGCCKIPMQFSTALDITKGERVETDYVACRSLKCKERNIRYEPPSIELKKIGAPEKKKPGPKPKTAKE